jgi:hypothetical protein
MDVDGLKQYALAVWKAKQGELVSLMVYLGDELGIFRSMAGSGLVTSGDVADATGLAERPLREWLMGMAAAGLLMYDAGRFLLPAEGTAVLVDEETSPHFAAGVFGPSFPRSTLDPVITLMRTGRGTPPTDVDHDTVRVIERMTGPMHRLALVPGILSQVEGLVDRLDGGARVLDLGCGSGVAGEQVARRFPRSFVVGIDSSPAAIDRARLRTADLDNVAFQQGLAREIGDGPYDVILAFDVLHDLARPDVATASVRAAAADDSVFVVKELRTGPTFVDNLKNPLLALFYGLSLIGCLQTGLSSEDGWGLGALGLHPELLVALLGSAGYGDVVTLDSPDPANFYVAARAI